MVIYVTNGFYSPVDENKTVFPTEYLNELFYHISYSLINL